MTVVGMSLPASRGRLELIRPSLESRSICLLLKLVNGHLTTTDVSRNLEPTHELMSFSMNREISPSTIIRRVVDVDDVIRVGLQPWFESIAGSTGVLLP